MAEELEPARIERLVLALEKAANAFNRLSQAMERKGSRADRSIKKRTRPAPANENAMTDSVRMQVDKAMKRIGR